MTATDLLRVALDDAPQMFVADNGFTGELTLWEGERGDPFPVALVEVRSGVRAEHLRLLGLLLAAAPHLADLLECQGRFSDFKSHVAAARDAIEEAAR